MPSGKSAQGKKVNSISSRRSVLKTAGVIGIAGLSGCAGSITGGGEKTLTLSTYGGSFEEHMRENIADPFEEEADENVTVELVPYAEVSKLRGMAEDPTIDVANLDDFYIVSSGEDLFLELDPDVVTNYADVYDSAKFDHGRGVNTHLYSYGLAIDDSKIDPESIQSWGDLWDPQFEGQIAIHNEWSMVMVMLARAQGGDEQNMQPLWDSLPELSNNVEVFYENSTDPEQFFEQGQVAIASWFDGRALGLQDDGMPITFHLPPEEGGVQGRGGLGVMKNTSNPELSQQLVDYALSEEAQVNYAESLYYGPSNSVTELDSDIGDRVVTEDDFGSLTVPDWDHIMANLDEWVELWNENI
jgi:putative spermidine/putrescine transport system substrate-binding protein